MYKEQLTFFQKHAETQSILKDMTFRLDKWSTKLPTDKNGQFIASEDFNTFKKRVHEIDVIEGFSNYTEALIKELFILLDAANNFVELNNRMRQTHSQLTSNEQINTKPSKYWESNNARWRYQNLSKEEFNDYVTNNDNPDKFNF